MAQVAPPDRGEIQALPPRRRLPRLGYLTDSGGSDKMSRVSSSASKYGLVHRAR
jgi:hypothetical protein